MFVTSERAKAEKPAAEIFRLALEEASLEPPEAVFVGDRLDVDILGARQAGLHAIWFDLQRPSLGSCDIEPNATIRSFEELPAAIASLNAA